MAPVAGVTGSGEAGDSAADDQHPPGAFHRRKVRALTEAHAPGDRVDGTVGMIAVAGGTLGIPGQLHLFGDVVFFQIGQLLLMLMGAGIAPHTPQAAVDVIGPSGGHLVHKFRIRKGLSADNDKIHKILCQHPFRILRRIDAADQAHFHVPGAFSADHCRSVCIAVVAGVKTGKFQRAVGAVVMAGGNVENICQAGEMGGKFRHVLCRSAPWPAVGAGDAQLNQEVLPHGSPQGAQDLQGEAHPIFQAAAVFVGAGIF